MKFYKYEMTEEQYRRLLKLLGEDIDTRYNNAEYWNIDIIEDFAHDNKLNRGG